MTANPENKVIADIDALIDEQLAAGPIDDYDANLYPDCNLCPHDWHGIRCSEYGCKCAGSTGEVPAAKPALVFGTGHGGEQGYYTLADIEEMRRSCRPVLYARPHLSGSAMDVNSCAHSWTLTEGEIPRCDNCGMEQNPQWTYAGGSPFLPVGEFVGNGPELVPGPEGPDEIWTPPAPHPSALVYQTEDQPRIRLWNHNEDGELVEVADSPLVNQNGVVELDHDQIEIAGVRFWETRPDGITVEVDQRRVAATIALAHIQAMINSLMGLDLWELPAEPFLDPRDWFGELEDDSLTLEYRRDPSEGLIDEVVLPLLPENMQAQNLTEVHGEIVYDELGNMHECEIELETGRCIYDHDEED